MNFKLKTGIILALLLLMTAKNESKLSKSKQRKKLEVKHDLIATPKTDEIAVRVIDPNQSVILPCEMNPISGGKNSNKTVKWTKDGQNVKNASNHERLSLTVNKLEFDDSGLYNCKICIDKRCSNSSVKLVVSYEQMFYNQSTSVGYDVVFNCFPPFNNNKYEAILIKLRRANWSKLLNSGNESKLIKSNILKEVTKKDKGWFTCVIRDRYTGKIISNDTAYLEVLGSSSNTSTTLVTIVVILLIIVVVLLAILWYQRKPNTYHNIKLVTVSKKTSAKGISKPIVRVGRQSMLQVLRNKKNPLMEFKYKFPLDMEWEFPREKLVLGGMLGKGAFGKVFLATTGHEEGSTSFAVRMLSEDHDDKDVEDLVYELEVMKMVGNHPNIVNLLGCCSKEGPLFVIMDYAAHGDLQSFLRKHRFESDLEQDGEQVICNNQLISYVYQIASGMKHLASVGCVHQDLKARNVLVCENYILKITDYGRDIFSQERLPKTSSGKISIQWMAPESLLEYTFNSKSNVWSFGVLFWEIMSLGGVPFPNVEDSTTLMDLLMQEKRLEKPKNCSDAAYSIMKDCWQIQPSNRPIFTEIIHQLKGMPCTVILENIYSEVNEKNSCGGYSYASVYDKLKSFK